MGELAISNTARRYVLDLLSGGERPGNFIASEFAMRRLAVSQLLRVLLDAA